MTLPEGNRWPGRLRLIGSLVPAGASVLDLGAGSQDLARFLPASCEYTGVDQPGFDMNEGRWPSGSWDVAVMAGVLEYARDPGEVLARVTALTGQFLLSYAHRGIGPEQLIVLEKPQLQTLALEAGWSRAVVVASWRGRDVRRQAIWRLT